MKKEEEQTLTPTLIAARTKKGLAIATGNPLDKIVISPPQVDKPSVQTEETLIERVVSIMQRRKRALQMKRSKPRIVRARNIKKTRLATQDQLMRRAMRMAKTMLRKRAAGARGANYNNLSPAQKINIDRQIEPRAKNIKAIATRLMPRVKAGEMKRLNAVRTHKSTKGVYGNVQNLAQSFEPVLYSKILGERVSSEDLNAMFSMYEGFVSSALAPVRIATKIAGGAVSTALALQTPKSAATALGGAALYGYNKLSNLGKGDPDKKKQEKTKQAQLKTKQIQQKPAKPSSPKPSSVSSTPAPKQQTQNAPKQQSTPSAPAAAQQQTANTYTSPSNFAQRISQIKKNIQTPATPSAQATSSFRQQKQAAAGKVARQQMGLVNHKEWDYESYLQEKTDQHLQKKADQHGVTFEEVKQVFEQGLADYIKNDKNTLHQFAMQRVNSYLAHDGITIDEGGPQENLSESFIVDRASGYSGVYTAKDLGIKMQGGFELHPSVYEDIGAGFEGTDKLTNKYKKDTPGEAVEAFARMMRAKRKASTPC